VKWQVILKKSARKELEALPDHMMQKIYGELKELSDNPFPQQSKKLRGGAGYRLRVGDYRVLYDLDKDNFIINISAVRHRREAYR